MKRKNVVRLGVIIVTAVIAVTMAACSQFEPRDKRFYYRALWNFALREDLAELDSEFNGVDIPICTSIFCSPAAETSRLLRTQPASKRWPLSPPSHASILVRRPSLPPI